MEEATLSLAAAKEISTKASITAAFSGWFPDDCKLSPVDFNPPGAPPGVWYPLSYKLIDQNNMIEA